MAITDKRFNKLVEIVQAEFGHAPVPTPGQVKAFLKVSKKISIEYSVARRLQNKLKAARKAVQMGVVTVTKAVGEAVDVPMLGTPTSSAPMGPMRHTAVHGA